jgi:hypothetical protein
LIGKVAAALPRNTVQAAREERNLNIRSDRRVHLRTIVSLFQNPKILLAPMIGRARLADNRGK